MATDFEQFLYMQLETIDYTSNNTWFMVTANGAADRDMVRDIHVLRWCTYCSQMRKGLHF